jgi:hypothetical protein
MKHYKVTTNMYLLTDRINSAVILPGILRIVNTCVLPGLTRVVLV